MFSDFMTVSSMLIAAFVVFDHFSLRAKVAKLTAMHKDVFKAPNL